MRGDDRNYGGIALPAKTGFDAVGLLGGSRGEVRGASEAYVMEVRGAPSCSRECPAGVNVKAYIGLIANRRFEEAVDVIREANPFPLVCGRVCTRPCEAGCEQSETGDPVAIRDLKRFAADFELARRPAVAEPCPVLHEERVAIVGAGPAGLTAAVDLVHLGYRVVVMEAGDEPGGMLRYGIPPYRLPKRVLAREIDWIRGLGVEVRTRTRVDDPVALLTEGYSAVLVAGGAPLAMPLGIPGEDAEGVMDALALLRAVNRGERPDLRGRTVVIGGGSTAVDAARTAARLRAEVTLAYRRGREEMPADPQEVAEAEAEGVAVRTLAIPKRVVVKGGRVTEVEFISARLGEPDGSGRRRPEPVKGSEFKIAADHVLTAIGAMPDVGTACGPGFTTGGGLVAVGDDCATSVTGVFAAGDVELGPATVVEAIGRGHVAAAGIDAYLAGRAFVPPDPRAVPVPVVLRPGSLRGRPREGGQTRHGPSDASCFDDATCTMDETVAVGEASRCLTCGPCALCDVCVPTCGSKQLVATVRGASFLLKVPPELAREVAFGGLGSIDVVTDGGERTVGLRTLTAAVDATLCIGCGRCEEACAYRAISTVVRKGETPVAEVAHDACSSCSACVSICPTGAISQGPMSDGAVLGRVREVRTADGDIAFAALWTLPAPTFGGRDGIVEVMHERRPTPAFLVRALAAAGRGVLVVGPDASCGSHYIERGKGPAEAVAGARALVSLSGVSPERIGYAAVPAGTDPGVAFGDFARRLDAIGLEPLDLPATPGGIGPLGDALAAIRLMASRPDGPMDDPFGGLEPAGEGRPALFEGCIPMLAAVGALHDLFDLVPMRDAARRLALGTGVAEGGVPGLACPSRGLAADGDPSRRKAVERIARLNRKALSTASPSRLVISTPEAFASMKSARGIEVTALPEALMSAIEGGDMAPLGLTVGLHGACSMEDDPFLTPFRRLLEMAGARVVTLKGSCGSTGLAASDAEARRASDALVAEAAAAGASLVACTSPNCLSHMLMTRREGAWRTDAMEVTDPYRLVLLSMEGER